VPEHLALGVNTIGGSVTLAGVKTTSVYFMDKFGNQKYYVTAPQVTLTVIGASSPTPFKQSNLKSGNLFIGFVLGFQNAINATVEWIALERG